MSLARCQQSTTAHGTTCRAKLCVGRPTAVAQKATHVLRCKTSRSSATVRCQATVLETTTFGKSTNIRGHEATVTREEKENLLGQRGCVIWFTGLSASGKSTVACALEHVLNERGHFTMLLDGDNVRQGLNSNLGFSADDRAENIRRIGEVAKLAADAGIITLTAFISPYRADRAAVRERMPSGDFLEVFMSVPLEECERRDPKGLYARARAGQIKNFTGIDDPYEEPEAPEVCVTPYDADGAMRCPYEMADQILTFLDDNGYLSDPRLRTIAASAAIGRRHAESRPTEAAMLSAML